jgi:putative ABC transport system permease protein
MTADEEARKELAFHIDERIRELIREGLDAGAARARAEQELGTLDDLVRQCANIADRAKLESARSARWDAAREDVRSGVRLLRRRPWPSAALILVSGLAVAAAVATSSVVSSTLLRPLPMPAPDEIVAIHTVDRRIDEPPLRGSSAPGDVADWARMRSFAAVSALNVGQATMFIGEEPERIEMLLVAQGIGEVVGVRPHLGRMFRDEDHHANAAPVIMLTYDYWRRAFGADSSVVGRVLRFAAGQAEVIGVLPRLPRFAPARDAVIWSAFDLGENPSRGGTWLRVIARMAPGVQLEAAQAELDVLMSRLAREESQTNALRSAWLEPLDQYLVYASRPVLIVIASAIAVVVLIALGNLAALLLAISADRRPEIALRSALGAAEGRLRRQFFAESLFFCALGGLLGLLIGSAATRAFLALYPGGLPRADEVGMGAPAIAGGCALALVFAALASLPLLGQIRARGPAAGLLSGSRLSSDRATARFRTALVVAQIAFCTVLLIAGILLLQVYRNLTNTPVGFVAEELVAFNVSPPASRYATAPDYLAFYDRLLERIEGTPGVSAASYTSLLPFDSGNWSEGLYAEGVPQTQENLEFVLYQSVAPDYTRVLGLPLLAGRELAETDREGTPRVAVVNSTVAMRMFGTAAPIGKRIGGTRGWLEIVGVVGAKRHRDLSVEPMPELFVPRRQENTGRSLWIVVRTTEPGAQMLTTLRGLLKQEDPNIAFAHASIMQDRVALSLAPQRFRSVLIGTLATLALVLATIGIWSLVAYSVSRRTREIGIRMALGLEPRQARRAVVQRALLVAIAGTSVGEIVALAVARGVSAQTWGLPPVSPATLVAVAALFVLITLLAAAPPAWRASAIDPLLAIRST